MMVMVLMVEGMPVMMVMVLMVTFIGKENSSATQNQSIFHAPQFSLPMKVAI